MSINVNIEKTMGDFCLKTKFDADIGITAILQILLVFKQKVMHLLEFLMFKYGLQQEQK